MASRHQRDQDQAKAGRTLKTLGNVRGVLIDLRPLAPVGSWHMERIADTYFPLDSLLKRMGFISALTARQLFTFPQVICFA